MHSRRSPPQDKPAPPELSARVDKRPLPGASAPRFGKPEEETAWTRIALPGGEDLDGAGSAFLCRGIFRDADCRDLFSDLQDEVSWEARDIQIFGKWVPQPRLVAYHGDPGASYRYSGTVFSPHPWTKGLLRVRARVEELVGLRFNSVLCNFYRSGADSMGWHSDDEPELGVDPVIASVSFGDTRTLRIRPRDRQQRGHSIGVEMDAGSLFLMTGGLQSNFHHQIPKVTSARGVGARVNLTFRRVRKEQVHSRAPEAKSRS